MLLRIFLLFILSLSAFVCAQAQSDTATGNTDTQKYGPHTTKYFYREDLHRDSINFHTLDSGLTDIHQYDHLYAGGLPWQNLGNIGTAARPVYWQAPQRIGYRLGLSAYDVYSDSYQNVRFFDTRSSFSELYYLQSVFVSTGEQIFKADVSRNVNPYFNIGASYKRIIAQKQIAEAKQEDKQSDGHLVNINFSYRPRKNRYAALGDFTLFNHEVYESGGVLPEEGTGPNDWFDNKQELSYLGTRARSSDRRRVFNTYQHLRLAGKGLSVFHQMRYDSRVYQYVDREITENNLPGPMQHYNNTYINPGYTEYLMHYSSFDNKLGLKSSSKYHFVSAWLERRDHRMSWGNQLNLYVPEPSLGFSEQFAGAEALGYLFDSVKISARAEALLFMTHGNEMAARRFSGNGDHRFSATAQYRFAEAGIERMSFAPAINEVFTDNNHFFWNNRFVGTSVDAFWAGVKFKKGIHSIKLNAGVNNVNRPVYFNQSAEATQFGSGLALFHTTLKGATGIGILGFDTDLQYHTRSGEDIIRFPAVFNLSRLYVRGKIFNKRLQVLTGLEIRFMSQYYADAYMPVTGMFFLQDDFMLKDYGVINFFASCKLDRARLFIRATHLNEKFDGSPGYFITPYYPGLRRSFQFGVYWMFFD